MRKVLLGFACVPAIALAGLTVEDDMKKEPGAALLVAPVKIEVVKAQTWTATAGSTVREELVRWAAKAGWKVVYDARTNFPIESDQPFEGHFEEAVGKFIKLYERAEQPLMVDISATQRLITITAPLEQRWEVRIADVTLAKTLSRWAQEAGYRLQWDAARNFLIGAPSSFSGGFEEAVAQALSTPGVRSSDYPLEACVYANIPPLLRVTRQGEQARECVAVAP